MKFVRLLILCVSVLALTLPAASQEGHPLVGTWYGDYGTGGRRHDLTLVLNWNGREITGVIHPGPNQIPIRNAVLDITPGAPPPEGLGSTFGTPPIFRLRFEASLPNSAGVTANVVFEGQLYNPVPANRHITGTWTSGNERGQFQIRRL